VLLRYSTVVAIMRFARIVLGAAAVSWTLGAAQFASGGDLQSTPVAVNEVNRASKADRISIAIRGVSQAPTISVRSSILADTSIAVRLPASIAINGSFTDRPKAPLASRKTAVACEPVVSVLTEVAKLLQPGRCVT